MQLLDWRPQCSATRILVGAESAMRAPHAMRIPEGDEGGDLDSMVRFTLGLCYKDVTGYDLCY